jgi:solute:Na+ symporter, SSS family
MYNNAMDIIQLVFGFVNAPLFATFLLGMFWKRTTGTGAFLGLFGGIAGSTLFPRVDHRAGNVDAAGHVINHMKGGYLGVVSNSPAKWPRTSGSPSSPFIVCFLTTVVISLATGAPRPTRVERPRLFAHAENRGPQPAGLAAARRRRRRAAHRLRHPEHHFLVNRKNEILN